MSQNIIEVLQKIVPVDTHPIETEKEMIVILRELLIYYNKKEIFSNPAVFVNVYTAPAFTFWDTWGNKDMPTSAPYVTMIESDKPNQTSAERYIKDYKFINDNRRTVSGRLSSAQFNSMKQDEVTKTGIKKAFLYSTTKSLGCEWKDPSELLVLDEDR